MKTSKIRLCGNNIRRRNETLIWKMSARFIYRVFSVYINDHLRLFLMPLAHCWEASEICRKRQQARWLGGEEFGGTAKVKTQNLISEHATVVLVRWRNSSDLAPRIFEGPHTAHSKRNKSRCWAVVARFHYKANDSGMAGNGSRPEWYKSACQQVLHFLSFTPGAPLPISSYCVHRRNIFDGKNIINGGETSILHTFTHIFILCYK